jgi:lambda family phage portal protein
VKAIMGNVAAMPLTPAQRFAVAQARAKTPGSAVLAGWLSADAGRAARAGLRPAQATNVRRFQAAEHSRLTSSWSSSAQRINDELRADLDALRTRSRHLAKNNDIMKRYLQMVETNVVGHGMQLQAQAENRPGDPDTLANGDIERGWLEWAKPGVCEITGHYDFQTLMQKLAVGVARDGEILLQEVLGAAAGNKFGYALRVIDVARIATWHNREATGGLTAIDAGVEIDSLGRPLAIHITDGKRASRTTQRVPIDTLIHRFVADEAEQRRGYPWAHAAMVSLHYLGEFSLSALLNAKQGADRIGFFVSPDGSSPVGDGGPVTDENGEDTGAVIHTSQPVSFDTLPEGYDVKSFESRYPEAMFGPFVKAINQRAASGLNVSYPNLCNDYEAVSFSSIRAAVLAERDEWRKVQRWFAANVLDRIYDRWLQYALANRALGLPTSPLPLAKAEKFRAHKFQPRGWDWVDPKNDMLAKGESLRNNLTTHTDILAEQGIDFEDVLATKQRERALAARYGVNLDPPAQPTAPPPAPDTPEQEQTP